MTSKKKLRSLLGGTLFMVLMLSVHPTTVSASAVGKQHGDGPVCGDRGSAERDTE